jgi:hypothetical protein
MFLLAGLGDRSVVEIANYFLADVARFEAGKSR